MTDIDDDIRTLNKRISEQFQPVSQTQYRIDVVDEPHEKHYNFFLEILPKYRRQKSVPLHTLKEYDLEYLEQVINGLSTKLTIVYRGFEGQRWPSNDRLIQK